MYWSGHELHVARPYFTRRKSILRDKMTATIRRMFLFRCIWFTVRNNMTSVNLTLLNPVKVSKAGKHCESNKVQNKVNTQHHCTGVSWCCKHPFHIGRLFHMGRLK